MKQIEFGCLYEIRIGYVIRTPNVIYTPPKYKILAIEACTELDKFPDRFAHGHYFKVLSQDGLAIVFYEPNIFTKIAK